MKRVIVSAVTAAAAAACAADPAGTGPSFDSKQTTTITVEKTAEGKLTKTFEWTIEKSAGTEALQLFRGDEAAVNFTVTATRVDSANVVSVAGEVCVTNAGSEPTVGLQIVDRVQAQVGAGEFQDISGATVTIMPEAQVAAGEETCYSYDIPFTPIAEATYRNVAKATILNLDGSEGTPAGPPDVTAAFTVPAEVTGDAFRSVNVQDSSGQSWMFDATGTQTYDQSFTCDEHAGTNTNIVTIVETEQEAEAAVTVECFALSVSKTAVTEYTRTWTWALEKTSDTSSLLIPTGFPYAVDYEVAVTATGEDGDAGVSGAIIVENPAPMAGTVLAVGDVVSPDIALSVTCPDVTFPVTLATGERIECSYAGALPDVAARTNTASATLQNLSYDAAGAATETGMTDFTGSAELSFGDPANEVDECVEVTDDRGGALGTVCAADLPEAFAYTLTWGPFDVCGEYEGTNTASFVTNDTEATGSSAWTVTVSVPCGPNCTLSHGYWKTHSAYGPAAKVDPTWLLLPQGPDQPFFESGYTWLSVIQAPSRGGDAYIILGRQYAAAWLNGLRGANVSAVADELQRAADLLDAYDGTPNAMSMITGDLRAEFIQLAELLDGFNNGLVGPGKCPEDDGSAS